MRVWLWALLAAPVLALLLPRLWQRLRVRTNPWPAWQGVLGGELEQRYDYLHEVFDGNAALVDALLGARAEPAPARTRESLAWGLNALAGFAATARERLAEWRLLAAVVRAEVPARRPTPRVADFERPELRHLMRLDALRGWLGREGWLAARLHLLECGFGLIGEIGGALAARVAGETWSALCDGAARLAHDFRLLGRETLAAARLLLAALDQKGARP